MPRLAYETWNPRGDAQDIVARANDIAADYQRQGYDLTLRQLYYQFVARGLIANKDTEYKRLGSVINRARMAGLMDWYYITDRTRNLASNGHWTSPAQILQTAAGGYAIDKWEDQPYHVEVWVEKEALAGIVGNAASARDIAYMACRGYMSQSEQWSAGRRILRSVKAGKRVRILHLGDHDPSGIDMTRDIRERLTTFLFHDWVREAGPPHLRSSGSASYAAIIQAMQHEYDYDNSPFEVTRLALNMDQVEEYSPPPNPAKTTDSRSDDYIATFGDESWELDALNPPVITALINDAVDELIDQDLYDDAEAKQERHRSYLRTVAENYVEPEAD